MWVFLGFPVGGLEGWSGGPQTSPIEGVLGGLIGVYVLPHPGRYLVV